MGKKIKKKKTTKNSEYIKVPVSKEEFVRKYQSSKTLEEAARKLKMKRSAVSVMAFRLRDAGVKLKKFQAGRPTLGESINKRVLNAIIRKTRGSR